MADNYDAKGVGGASPGGEAHKPTEEEARYQAEEMKAEASEVKEEAKAKGQSATERAKANAQSMTEKAKAGASSMKDQAKDQAYKTAGKLRQQAESTINRRKDRAANEVGRVSSAIHEAASKLYDEQDEALAGYVDAVAEQGDRAAEYLHQKDFWGLIDDAQGLARRRPEIFLGGMFLAGMGLARFLKASGSRASRYHHEREPAWPGEHGRSVPTAPQDQPATPTGPAPEDLERMELEPETPLTDTSQRNPEVP